MNTYKKYCPNVFIAQCEEEYKKGDIITIVTKYGKENEHIIHNLVMKTKDYFYYSITRADGFNSQERAKNKAEKLSTYAGNAQARSEEYLEKADEGKDFLSLGEPIKIGHHSERSHRALLERNWNRMSKAIEYADKAQEYQYRVAYWESLADQVNLSMPESIGFFRQQLEEAVEYHQGIKEGTIKRDHSYSLTYAKKRCNELQKKYDIAIKLWA